MAHWKSAPGPAYRPGSEILKAHAPFALSTVVPLVLLVSLVPPTLLLPVTCLLALAGAGVVAAFAWWRRAARHSDRVTAWDVAGVLTLIGFAAGVLAEPEHVVQLFDRSAMTR